MIYTKENKYKTQTIDAETYAQDESRFGLKTHIGSCLTAKDVKPIVNY
ncbi:hypothetical protein L3X37_07360 [Sabulilitoribacter arenilitoris]|uniref:Uncharacterized protein n=1 Tax=Wocania arenilitoris TaxID=2044858 RepID=A0AAE3JLE4_9FLAO|nr:hypothetical protein [Wocania arenilitoris]MCF7568179.1 hypothetical protein [Wocania arenilitoris]